MDISADQILKDAREKHLISFPENVKTEDLLSLIRYAMHVGYNRGYMDHKNMTKEK